MSDAFRKEHDENMQQYYEPIEAYTQFNAISQSGNANVAEY